MEKLKKYKLKVGLIYHPEIQAGHCGIRSAHSHSRVHGHTVGTDVFTTEGPGLRSPHPVGPPSRPPVESL